MSPAPPWIVGFIVGNGPESQVRCGGAVVGAGSVPASPRRAVIVATAAHCLAAGPRAVFFGYESLEDVPDPERFTIGKDPTDNTVRLGEAVASMGTDLALLKVLLPAGFAGELPPAVPRAPDSTGALEALFWGNHKYNPNHLNRETGLVRADPAACSATNNALRSRIIVDGWCFDCVNHVCEPQSSGGPVLSDGRLAGLLCGVALERFAVGDRWVARDDSLPIRDVFDAAHHCGLSTWKDNPEVCRVGDWSPTLLLA